jgi:hypothetical protein
VPGVLSATVAVMDQVVARLSSADRLLQRL